MNVNFITNLPLSTTSGGWGGISAKTFEQLSRFYSTKFVGPINPPYPFLSKISSKILRKLGLQGKFTLFDDSRLFKISLEYNNIRSNDSEFDFFHGATPWIKCHPPCRYGAYIDATFPMYLEIYSKQETFSYSDIKRITELECNWLQKADVVFFGSDWVKDRAIKDYNLSPLKCQTIWVGGNVPIPEFDKFNGGRKFLFISLDFVNKGGYYCVEALKKVRKIYPDAELIIIGQKPPEKVLLEPGVSYAGFFKKTIPSELNTFCEYLSLARGLVHPTSMDTMGMVLIEAGYHFCPSISTRRFGIPELILENYSGHILDIPISSNQLAEYMLNLCKDTPDYYQMRLNARNHSTKNLTWDYFGERISRKILR